jgi:hypothetical protein
MTQTFQFGRVREQDETLLRYSAREKGRPNLGLLKLAAELGYNYVWLYTKKYGEPELVDGIVLSRRKISMREKAEA